MRQLIIIIGRDNYIKTNCLVGFLAFKNVHEIWVLLSEELIIGEKN